MSIVTKKGDDGKSKWVAKGGRHDLWKDDPLLEVIGELDGLQCSLGVVRAMLTNKELNFMVKEVQLDLWALMGCLSGEDGKCNRAEERIGYMETMIQKWERKLPTINSFVVPGESQVGARLHWCRAIARRGERRMVTYFRSQKIKSKIQKTMLIYMNRLSDYLFMMARVCDES